MAHTYTIKLIYQGGGPQDGHAETTEIDSSMEDEFIERRYPIEGSHHEHVYQSSSPWEPSQAEVALAYLGLCKTGR